MPSSLPSHQLASRKSFTLLELITVIGLMGLIAAISIPAFSSINRGSNMRAAQYLTQSGVSQTRQQAVSLRQRAAFGIPYRIYSAGQSYVQSNMLQRCFVVFTQEGTLAPRPVRIIGKIQQLPKGIVFNNNYTGWTPITFVDTSGNSLFSVWCFRFAPIGTLYSQDMNRLLSLGLSEYQVILTEGTVNDLGVMSANPNSPLIRTNSVNPFTGRCFERTP